MPTSLGDYVSRIVGPMLAKWSSSGAVAVKLLVAYQRSLDFQQVDATQMAEL
jgi:hypothetical protein